MRLLVLAITVVAVGAVAASAGARTAAKPKGKLCGQLKHGPYAAYHHGRRRVSGRTWSVLAFHAPCRISMRLAPRVLKRWASAKVGDKFHLNEGKRDWLLCTKPSPPELGFPAAACGFVDPHYALDADIAFLMTGKLSPARVRKLIK